MSCKLLLFLCPALLLPPLAMAQDDLPTPGEFEPESIGISITGVLHFAVAEAGKRGPVSRRPEAVELSPEAPVEFEGLPTFNARPLFGLVRLGRSGRVYLALDRSDRDKRFYDRLYIDTNTNRNLADDGPPAQGASLHVEHRDLDYTEFTAVRLALYYGQDTSEPFAFTFYMWYPRTGDPPTLLCTAASWREGTFTVEGQSVRVGVFDDNNDGLYMEKSCLWSLVPEAEADQLFAADRTLPAMVPFRVAGVPYRIADVMPEGRRLELTSETESAARQAELTYDPTRAEPARPVTDKPVDWAGDLDLALRVAGSDRKSVLLWFSVDWARASNLLEERTFQDKEVADLLAAHYLCVRANPDQHKELAQRYQVVAAPTCLVLDPRGNVLARMVGYRQARTMAAELRKYR